MTLQAYTAEEALIALEIESLPDNRARDYSERSFAAAVARDAWNSTSGHVKEFADSFRFMSYIKE